MSKSLKIAFHNKYKKRINSLLLDPYASLYPEDKHRTYDLFGDRSEIIRMKINHYLTYFKYVNGFLGYDYLMLKHVAFDLFLYLFVSNEQLSERLYNKRNNEICIQFYLFLNCIYNIKDKYMYYLGCKNIDGKLSFENTVLSESGIKATKSNFSKAYRVISKYCDARNSIVHNTYILEYNEVNIVSIKTFSFNLRQTKDLSRKSPKKDFIISEEEISKVIYSLYSLRFGVYNILSNISNIDKKKFMKKYEKDGEIIIQYP